jgi:hypothetical protein
MATNRTDSFIATIGAKDYSTLQAWEDDIGVGLGTSTNLVTDDYEHHGWLKGEEFDQDVVIAGHTTDSTHFIKLQANSASRPAGTGSEIDEALMDADRALAYNTSYSSILCNTGYGTTVSVTDQYTQLERLQFDKAVATCRAVHLNSTGSSAHRCLFDASVGSNGAGRQLFDGGIITSSICIVDASTQGIFYAGVTWVNCTIVFSSGNKPTGVSPVGTNYARPDTRNVALFFGGTITGDAIPTSGGSGWTNLDYNATDEDDFSSKSGEGSNNVYDLTMSDQFTAVDNTDWRLKAGNDLAGAGTNATSGTASEDIFGTAFDSGDWTIGCQHYASPAGGAPPFDISRRTIANTILTR